jgi:hypothetical protein
MEYQKLFNFIERVGLGKTFTRNEMLVAVMPGHDRNKRCVFDHYRKFLVKARYLKVHSRGLYKIQSLITEGTTMEDIKAKAYPLLYGKANK